MNIAIFKTFREALACALKHWGAKLRYSAATKEYRVTWS